MCCAIIYFCFVNRYRNMSKEDKEKHKKYKKNYKIIVQ